MKVVNRCTRWAGGELFERLGVILVRCTGMDCRPCPTDGTKENQGGLASKQHADTLGETDTQSKGKHSNDYISYIIRIYI